MISLTTKRQAKKQAQANIKQTSAMRTKEESLQKHSIDTPKRLSDITKSTEELYTYLVERIEEEAADKLLDIANAPVQKDNNAATKADIKKLSDIDTKILSELKSIREDAIDEQDTSIKKTSDSSTDVQPAVTNKEVKKEKQNSNWIKGLLTSLFGGAMVGMMIDAKDLKPYQFAAKLFKLASKDILKGMAKIGSESFKFVMKTIEPITNGMKKTLDYLKSLTKPITTMISNIKGYLKTAIEKIGPAFGALIPDKLKAFAGITKTSNKGAQTAMSKVASKSIKLAIGKTIGKTLSKKIPFVGLGVATALATSRASEGDYIGAGMEIASGIAAIVPVVGTAASFGIDAMLIAKDYRADGMSPEIQAQFDKNIVKERTDKEYKRQLRTDKDLMLLKELQIESKNQFESFLKNGGDTHSQEFKDLLDNLKNTSAEIKDHQDAMRAKIEKGERQKMTTPKSVPNTTQLETEGVFKLYQNPNIEGLDDNVRNNLTGLGQEYYSTFGKRLQINSAFRSFQEQQDLKRQFPDKAAAPGSSMHNYGMAVDLNSSDLNKADKAGLLTKYGFHRPITGEPWHLEPKGINREAIRITGMEEYNNDQLETVDIQNIKQEGKVPESSKNNREELVQKVSSNLVQNTRQYDNVKMGSNQDTEKYQNTIINSTKDDEYQTSDMFSQSKL